MPCEVFALALVLSLPTGGLRRERGGFSVDPRPLDRAVNVVQVAALKSGLCVRYRGVRCVGANDVGQRGMGYESDGETFPTYSHLMDSDELVAVAGLNDARDIGCGPRLATAAPLEQAVRRLLRRKQRRRSRQRG